MAVRTVPDEAVGNPTVSRRSPRTQVPPRFAVHAAMKLRGFLLRAADRVMPSELAVLEHSAGFATGYLLAAMVELGVPDELAKGPRTADELATSLHCNAGALHRALRMGAVHSLVRLDPQGRFHTTRLTEALTSDAPYSSDQWCSFMASKAHQNAWGDLAETLRTGESAFRRQNGMSFFEWFDAHPGEGRAFAGGLSGLTLSEASAIASSYRFPGTGVVCDIAGGVGAVLGEVLRRNKNVRGILVEAPLVLPEAAEYLASLGLTERVELRPGDLFGDLRATADVYLLKWVLHDWDDADCVRLLRNVAAAMPTGAKLVVVEGVQERSAAHARFSPIDLQMLVVTDGGRERSISEIQGLMTEAGLRPTTVDRTPADLALLEAVKG
jgi:O-methyltransferase domain